MPTRNLSLLPFLALLCGGAVVIGMPSLRPMHAPLPASTTAPLPATVAPGNETDPSEFPPRIAHTPVYAAALAPATGPRTPDRPDPDAVRAQIEADIAMLDAQFAAEPLDGDWAQREERAVRAFFAADALRTQGLPMPDALQTTCHSATCRISARYLDPIGAEVSTRRLSAHLATRLPYGTVRPRPLDDGGVQIEAWYSARRMVL
jgi:hypothetical protein